MADMTITKGTPIFNTGSQSRVSAPFKVTGTIAITGLGLQADDEITFEIVELKEGTLVDENGCCGDGCATTLNKPPVNVVSATPILCCGCGCSTLEQLPRKLDKNNPRIFMDDMDGLTLRAVWNNSGSGFGTASVLRTSSQKTNLTAAEKGCCEELPKCPAVTIVATPLGTNSINVAVTSAEPVFVELNGVKRYINGGQSTVFTGLDSSTEYYVTAENDCGAIASAGATTADCPAVDFTATALSTTSLEVTALTGAPLDISIVSQGGAVLDAFDGLSSTTVFNDLPEGAIVTVKAVNECGKKKQLNVSLPDPVANPCPSFSLADASPYFKGFAYVAGDLIDPAATVAYRGGFIYPAAGEGHTVKVTDNLGAVIGYAVNKSDCANQCCTPLVNKTDVCGATIDEATDKYFTKGNIKTCVNGELVDLDCNMIVKTIPDCEDCEINTWITQDSQLSGGGVCQFATATAYDNGVAILAMRDFSNVRGNIVFTGLNPPTHFPYTYTNNTDCPVLFEAYLTGHFNVFAAGSPNTGTLGVAYNIGTVLNYQLPQSFQLELLGNNVNDAGTMRSSMQRRGVTGSDSPFDGYQEQTVSGARCRAIVAPGQTVTVFAQAWIMLFESDPLPNETTVHTNMQLDIKVTKGAAYL